LKHCAKLLQSEALRLAQASSIDELFFILSPHWDFLNPSLLAHLAYRFGDEQTIRPVEEYLGELREFRMRTKVDNFIDMWTGELPPDTQEIVMKLGDNWREKSLEQLEELRIEVSRKRCFEDYVMPLKRIKVSSVDAIFSLPGSVDIHSLELESLREVFQKHHVLRILVNGVCQFQGLEEERRLLEEQNAQSHFQIQTGSLMLEGERERSGRCPKQAENGVQGSVSHSPSIKINEILGPESNLELLDTQWTDSQKKSEEFVHLESDQHASGSNVRPEGSILALSVHSLEKQRHEQTIPLTTDYTENWKDSVNWSTLNTTRTDFETRLLSLNLQSQGLNRAGRLLEKMNMPNQIQSQGECLENQTNCTVSEAEQCGDTSIEHTQSNYTEGSIPNVMFPGIEDRLLSQSLQNKGLEGAGRLLEEMHMQRQIPPRAECTENQTNCMVQVMKKPIMHKPTTQTDQSEPIVVNSSDDEHEAQVSVLLSPSMQFQGLKEERRLLEEQNPQSHIQIQRELECTKNQMGTIMMEAGQATSMSDPVTAEDPNNITQCPVSNKPGIQERDMDCTVNKEVYVTPEGGQRESGIDIRPAVGINDRDIPQRGRKRGLSTDPSPSKGKFIRMKRDESYVEPCQYAIILPFQCPSNQKVVKVGVSGTPKRWFEKIKWGLKAIIPDEFAEPAELKLKDGICLSRTTPADKIIDEIFLSRIRMQAVEHQKAELEVRNLIMAAKNIDHDFTMSSEAIYDTSDTREEADKKIHRINNNCGQTEWILSDTRTVEALRNAYKNGELDGTAKSMMDDKPIWGSYQEFIGELQKVRRNVYQ